MTTNEKVARRKLSLLELAKELNKGSSQKTENKAR